MDQNLSTVFNILTGITISFAIANLLVGFQKGANKAYLFLGLIGFFASIFILSNPHAENGPQNAFFYEITLFSFLLSFALMPWFFCFYTGYCNAKWQWWLSGSMVFAFIVRTIGHNILGIPLWNIIGHISLAGIIWFGFNASIYQFRNGDKNSSRLLLGSLVLFSLIAIDDILNTYFKSIYHFNVTQGIFLLDYFMILFMIVMGLQLVRDMQQKYQLEKTVNLQEKRWGNMLETIHLLVISVDAKRTVTYVNPFFLKISGFRREDVVGHQFTNIIPEKDRKKLIEDLDKSRREENFQYFQNTILTKYGEEKTITWTIVDTYNENGDLLRSISIGTDITEQNKAINEIIQLKSKLEEENILLKQELGKLPDAKKIVGTSDAIKYVLQRALQVAPTNTTVILEGETGVGKELVTNYIQQNSERSQKPFVKVNCAAIPASLLESELFGHVKGAFTGADRIKKGMVEMADGGTLFLDEIGEFPIDLQPKLLRFLQEGEFVPLGSEQAKQVDVRIITATNRELLKEIEAGRFRNDLYYRIYVYPITIPPLRNRSKDIPELAEMFLKKFAVKHGKQINKISKLVIEELKKYDWPGNIRELENVLERAVIVSTSDTIKIRDLSPVFTNSSHVKNIKPETITSLEDAEREHILKALNHTNWQVHGKNGAAELLGINASTLRSRMKKLDIIKP